MARFQLSFDIARPAVDVFAYLADLRNDVQWRREWVDGSQLTEGPTRVGTVFRLVGKLVGRRLEVDYETTAYDEGRAVAWTAKSGGLPLSFRREVDAVGEGSRVTMIYDLDLRGPFKMFTPWLGRLGRRALEGDLPALEARLGPLSSPPP